jgi:hypothetical protein
MACYSSNEEMDPSLNMLDANELPEPLRGSRLNVFLGKPVYMEN